MPTATPATEPDDTGVPPWFRPLIELERTACPACIFGVKASPETDNGRSLRCSAGHEYTPSLLIHYWYGIVHQGIHVMRMAEL